MRGPDDGRSIESLVQNAIGDSVTPSRLKNPNSIGFFRRLLGHQSVEGPFLQDLETGEQPHYLFATTSGLSFPEDDDEFGDELFSFVGEALISPAVLIITDQRSIFVYGRDDQRRSIGVPHQDIEDIVFSGGMIEPELSIVTVTRKFDFGMWKTDPHSSELVDAAAYLSDKADIEGTYEAYDFKEGEYRGAREALREQLSNFGELASQIDLKYVTRCSITGAKIGARRGHYGAGIGFLLAAGYGIWSDLSGRNDDVTDHVDPEHTAEVMLRWQQAGKVSQNRGVELAAGAIGAAVAIDEQTTGRDVTRALSQLDVEWVAEQLEAGETAEASLTVASEMLENYSAELSELLDDDFFQELLSQHNSG